MKEVVIQEVENGFIVMGSKDDKQIAVVCHEIDDLTGIVNSFFINQKDGEDE